jgi:hypothetical protein
MQAWISEVLLRVCGASDTTGCDATKHLRKVDKGIEHLFNESFCVDEQLPVLCPSFSSSQLTDTELLSDRHTDGIPQALEVWFWNQLVKSLQTFTEACKARPPTLGWGWGHLTEGVGGLWAICVSMWHSNKEKMLCCPSCYTLRLWFGPHTTKPVHYTLGRIQVHATLLAGYLKA